MLFTILLITKIKFEGIGQKFALLEEKSILSAVLRNYELEACERREDITLKGELILRPRDGLQVRIKPRAPYTVPSLG